MRASPFRSWAAFGLLFLAPMVLHAQPIFRCGNTYSQTPCPGALSIAADDRRSAEQKAQTDAAGAQAARQADHMEHERLARERSANAMVANARAATARNKSKPPLAHRGVAPKKKPEPALFTASTGLDNKKQPPDRPDRPDN